MPLVEIRFICCRCDITSCFVMPSGSLTGWCSKSTALLATSFSSRTLWSVSSIWFSRLTFFEVINVVSILFLSLTLRSTCGNAFILWLSSKELSLRRYCSPSLFLPWRWLLLSSYTSTISFSHFFFQQLFKCLWLTDRNRYIINCVHQFCFRLFSSRLILKCIFIEQIVFSYGVVVSRGGVTFTWSMIKLSFLLGWTWVVTDLMRR